MEFFKRHYEKLILGLFLIGALVWCWVILREMTATNQQMAEIRHGMISSPGESRPAKPLDRSTFRGVEILVDPSVEWQMRGDMTVGTLVDPYRYVRCVNVLCPHLLPFEAKICPFCGTDQGGEGRRETEDPNNAELDSDNDNIPDKVEKQHKFLDIHDASDAAKDEDADGFSNLEEVRAHTKLDDPNSHPPFAAKVRFLRTVQTFLPITFDKLTRQGEDQKKWTFQFSIIEGNKRITRFCRLGEKIGEYQLMSVSAKIVTVKDAKVNMTFDKDVSEVVVKKGDDDPITMVRELPVPEKGMKAELIFLTDPYQERNCPRYELKVGDDLTLGWRKAAKEVYTLKNANATEAVLVRKDDPKAIEIKVPRLDRRRDFLRQRNVDGSGMRQPGGGASGMPGMPPGMPGGIQGPGFAPPPPNAMPFR